MMGWGDWLNERLGFREACRRELDRPVPSHVNAFHTLGATALALIALLAVTGVLLALNYTPTMDGAHASVRRITHELAFGWVLRSIHHWSANLLVVTLLAHMLVAFGYRAYAKPRELTWISGGLLLFLTLAFCLTGYLLPMEQLSYWATTVVTDVWRDLPLFDDGLARLIRGGDEITDVTLSRFFVAHILILPAAVAALAGMHLLLVKRLGIAPKPADPNPPTTFGKILHKDILAVTVMVAVVLTLAVAWPRVVEAPFDRFKTEKGTRPEWYFLPAYQLLKYFPKLLGLALLHVGGLLLLVVPWIDRGDRRRRAFSIAAAIAAGVVLVLGILGYVSDRTLSIFGSEMRFDDWGLPQ